MDVNFESRYAISTNKAKQMDTDTLRAIFLIESLFEVDKVNLTFVVL